MTTMTHTWHRNTFGLLYGHTSKTACSKRIATENIVPRLNATCRVCQDEVIRDLLELHESYQHALRLALDSGFNTLYEYTEYLKETYDFSGIQNRKAPEFNDEPMPVNEDLGLEPGKRYRLKHRSGTQKIPRESVMTFLSFNAADAIYSFSARPVAGTQPMPRHWILACEEVPLSMKPYVNRVSR